ncbi:MAG: hypothetical protein QM778_35420 [Myxococcales bacterium]
MLIVNAEALTHTVAVKVVVYVHHCDRDRPGLVGDPAEKDFGR